MSIEISGCREIEAPDGNFTEVVRDPGEADFWTVYSREPDENGECLAVALSDWESFEDAYDEAHRICHDRGDCYDGLNITANPRDESLSFSASRCELCGPGSVQRPERTHNEQRG